MGVTVETTDDSITVHPIARDEAIEHVLATYHDHRMAMAFSTLASVTGGITVDHQAVVDKTYPHYWQDYGKLLA